MVTNSVLRTPKQSYDLKNVEYISVKQPLFLMALIPALCVWAFAFSFARYLYPVEIQAAIFVPLVVLIIAKMTGTLKVHSLALRDGDSTIFGTIGHLRKVKEAVETGMDSR